MAPPDDTTSNQEKPVSHTPAEQPQQTCCLAIVSFVLGIAGWLGLWLLGSIPAVICGHMAIGRIKRSSGKLGGRGLAMAGLIVGYANIAVIIMFLLVCLVYGIPMLS